MPDLPPKMAASPAPLTPIPDNSVESGIKAGYDAEVAYRNLKIQYNLLVSAWRCVEDAINNNKAPQCGFDVKQK